MAMTDDESRRYVSRAGVKLEHALSEFGIDPAGLICADFGCNVGGFTDCLLQHGAEHVYAIDTGYGVLDYRFRIDDRVTVMERTNVLHADAPQPVDLIAIDLGWTTQRHAIPAALKWLRRGGTIVTLIKPHYELTDAERRERIVGGRLDPETAEAVMLGVVDELMVTGGVNRSLQLLGWVQSPITGGKSGRRSGGNGNVEYLAALRG